MMLRRAFVCWFVLIAFWGGASATVQAQPVRPLVIVFPDYGASGATGVEATQKDGLNPAERTRLAQRAVRSQLSDSGVVDAIIYLPGASMFVRAVKESNLKIANPDSPTHTERGQLGKAVGAIYVVSVAIRSVEGTSGVELVLEGEDTQNHKTWTDKISTSSIKSVGGITPSGQPGDPNGVTPAGGSGGLSSNALQSAANTLVLRLLAGPLGEYTRSTALPSALPPPQVLAPPANPVIATPAPPVAVPTPEVKPTPAPGSTPPIPAPPAEVQASEDDIVLAARQQAEASLASGDIGAAIVLLRRAINQVPLSLPLRISLTRAYIEGKRGEEAASEARRALRLIPSGDRAALSELSRLLAQSLTQAGDSATARATYEEIIAAQPDAQWARVALADLLASQGDADAADALYQAVLKASPDDAGATLGIVRLRAAKSDYASVLTELAKMNDKSTRARTATILFDEGAMKIGNLLTQNRGAWEAKTLSRESLYKATASQSSRVTNLTTILTYALPQEGSGQIAAKAYRRRVYAASLLAQSVTALLNYLETSDADAGAQAALQLTEFQKELAQVQSDDPATAIAGKF